MQAVPKIHDKHSFFDDGKMKESRHHIAEILDVVSPDFTKLVEIHQKQWDEHRGEHIIVKSLYRIWREEIDKHRQSERVIIVTDNEHDKPGKPWLYEENTDYFIKCSIPDYDKDPVWFVRDITGGWFSIETAHTWMAGRLMPIEFNYKEYFNKIYG